MLSEFFKVPAPKEIKGQKPILPKFSDIASRFCDVIAICEEFHNYKKIASITDDRSAALITGYVAGLNVVPKGETVVPLPQNLGCLAITHHNVIP